MGAGDDGPYGAWPLARPGATAAEECMADGLQCYQAIVCYLCRRCDGLECERKLRPGNVLVCSSEDVIAVAAFSAADNIFLVIHVRLLPEYCSTDPFVVIVAAVKSDSMQFDPRTRA